MSTESEFVRRHDSGPQAPVGSVQTFEVVLTGEINPRATREEVVRAMAVAFRRPLSSVEGLLSGGPRTVKRGLGRGEARRYLQTMLNAGAQAIVRDSVSGSDVSHEFMETPGEATPTMALGSVTDWTETDEAEDAVPPPSEWTPPSGPVPAPRAPIPPAETAATVSVPEPAPVVTDPEPVEEPSAADSVRFPEGYIPPAERIRRARAASYADLDVGPLRGQPIPVEKPSADAGSRTWLVVVALVAAAVGIAAVLASA